MSIDERLLRIKSILDGLRAECGHSEFGYRMQAILAHVLLRLGARVYEVNPQGHPDIRAELQHRQIIIQAKAILHSGVGSQLVVTRDDHEGICSNGTADGYLAVLDCALPVTWFLIPEDKVRLVVDRPTYVSTLRADREEPLSSECTDVFLDLIIGVEERLGLLTFRLLADRVLRGEML